MNIVLKQEEYQVKNGFASGIPELGLAAHGRSPELAGQNLKRIVLCFLKPFEREGTLEKEIRVLETKGIKVERNGSGLNVVLASQDEQ
jgi:hypothetical protein